MKVIKSFGSFKVNEGAMSYKYSDLIEEGNGVVTLYRLTSHPVVDLSEPGEFYVCDISSVDPNLLDKKGSEMFLITVRCDASNIDGPKSEQECEKLNNPCIVAVKDDKKCEVVSAVPYKG